MYEYVLDGYLIDQEYKIGQDLMVWGLFLPGLGTKIQVKMRITGGINECIKSWFGRNIDLC